MHRLFLLLATALVLFGCRKKADTATVTFWGQCGGCRITYAIDGTTLGSDSIGGTVPTQLHFPAEVGQEAHLTAQALTVTNAGMAIVIRVDGYQQAFAALRPTTAALLDSVLELRVRVPKLDRYGVEE